MSSICSTEAVEYCYSNSNLCLNGLSNYRCYNYCGAKSYSGATPKQAAKEKPYTLARTSLSSSYMTSTMAPPIPRRTLEKAPLKKAEGPSTLEI